MKERTSQCLVGLVGVAGRRIEEAVDARGDMRHEKIGRAMPAIPARPSAPIQNRLMPAMKNSVIQTRVTSSVWPKSGWSTSMSAKMP